jgi:predicted tellurium resistance membrane protein TerC
VKWVEEYDFGYIVFGLGLMTGGSTITDNYWGIILFMLAGAGFLAMGISRLNSRRMKDLSETSPKLAIIIGIVLVALGVSWGLIRWNEILKAPIEGVDALRGYWLLAMGMAYAIAGLLMQGRRRKETFMVDFQI